MKRSVLSGLLLGSAALLLAQKASKVRGRKAEKKEASSEAERKELAEQLTRRYITYAMFPAWAVAGFLDYIWHRQTRIETTSGTEESLTHLLMMAEAGTPIVMALFLEINAGVLAAIIAGWLLHQLTVYWDLAYTSPRRPIYPREQMTHLFMQTVPLDILAALACFHPEQFKALFGAGNEKRSFALHLKRPGMPPAQAVAMLGATAAFVWLPHLEEFWRCWRAQQQGLTGSATPECARKLYAS